MKTLLIQAAFWSWVVMAASLVLVLLQNYGLLYAIGFGAMFVFASAIVALGLRLWWQS